jgi:hypothetical protein
MMGGDISNETPPRIVVIIDVVADSQLEEAKILKIKRPKRTFTTLKKENLSKLWMITNNYGLSTQLAGFQDEYWDESEIQRLMDKLDNRGGNPFNYSEVYQNVQDLVDELPYLPNLKGVVDIRERVARYGSWGIELQNL